MVRTSAVHGDEQALAKSDPAGLALRLVAAARLRDVLAGSRFAPLGPAELPDSRDRALANRLVTTALRRHGHLNLMIHHLLERGMPGRSGTFEAVLRISLAQLLFLPDLGAHSALFLAGEAVKRDKKAAHLSGLINALLRRAQAEAESLTSAPLDLLFPERLRKGWVKAYGEEAVIAFGEAMLAGAPLDLTLKSATPQLISALGAEPVFADSVRIEERDKSVDALPGYSEGEWWVQDMAASLPARFFNLPPGSRVLDMCAAPGGKTAQLIKAGFQVTALDNDGERLARVRTNLDRLGYEAELVEADATRYEAEIPYDAILLDAPCSATGTFRRHPEVVWHRSQSDVKDRVVLQRKMIAKAVENLKPGGVLVYCVCSLEPDEGEDQARWAAETFPQLRLFPALRVDNGALNEMVTRQGYLRTHPGQIVPGGGTLDGFFIARFKKV